MPETDCTKGIKSKLTLTHSLNSPRWSTTERPWISIFSTSALGSRWTVKGIFSLPANLSFGSCAGRASGEREELSADAALAKLIG